MSRIISRVVFGSELQVGAAEDSFIKDKLVQSAVFKGPHSL